MERRIRAGLWCRHLLGDLPNALPQFVASGAGLGREREQGRCWMLCGQAPQGVVQLIVGKAVALGGYEQEFAAGGTKEVQELAVALLRRNIRIHQNHAQSQGGTLVEVGLDEFWP